MSGLDVASSSSRNPAARGASSSALPSISLSRSHITEALSKSPDNGATLDLAHKGLSDVGESGAEELATVGQEADGGPSSMVVRIALAHNRLTTLPMAFALLSRLRYLVLKNNNFSVFPDVLTVMPSLEILDISRNKIKRLPSQPGSLVNLRVFSISRNKIHRLPPYIASFHHLTLFKADHNPIEWPPKAVMEPHGDLDDPHMMSEWIKSVQSWIEEHVPSPAERKLSEDSQGDQSIQGDGTVDNHFKFPPDSSPSAHKTPLRAKELYHARSFSLESDTSAYFQLDRLPSTSAPSSSRTTHPDWPSRLQLGPFPIPYSTATSPSRSPEKPSPSPEESFMNGDDTNSPIQTQHPLHGRNASYAGGGPRSRRTMSNKKSLPDLRPNKLFLASGKDTSHRLEAPLGSEHIGATRVPVGFRHLGLSVQDSVLPSPLPPDRPAPAMDVQRHSYFRRLSALTPSSKSIPKSLLALVDAIRGILFAVSQIYQTLQHYTVYAIDERLSAVLLKVLDPASTYMTQLINALDRFDSMSRRTTPPPSVCRSVVESCRDNVTVFGKAVGVLALQLKVLATHDDVRYTRQMLLVLYGAMAEITSSWQAMTQHIEAVRPLLWESRPPVAKSHTQTAQIPTIRASTMPPSMIDTIRTASSSGGPYLPPDGLTTTGHERPRTLLRSNSAQGSIDHGRVHVSRRHAGSFSSKDVEIGKMLPSSTESPHLTSGVVAGASTAASSSAGVVQTHTLRTTRRLAMPQPSTPNTLLSTTKQYSHQQQLSSQEGTSVSGVAGSIAQRWDTSHSRQGSSNSVPASSTSSPSLGFTPFEVPSNTNTLVDKDLIEAMKMAAEAAPAIWEMMDEILTDAQEDLREMLSKAKDVTERMRVNVVTYHEGVTALDNKQLYDEARLFVKLVIQLSHAIKTHGAAHHLSSAVRTNMVKLTNATEEFVILLHVSSFSPAPTPRPYSPMVGLAMPTTPLAMADDGKLGANLSRTRPPPKSSSPLRDAIRSAQPQQSNFIIPNPPRFGPARKYTVDDLQTVLG